MPLTRVDLAFMCTRHVVGYTTNLLDLIISWARYVGVKKNITSAGGNLNFTPFASAAVASVVVAMYVCARRTVPIF